MVSQKMELLLFLFRWSIKSLFRYKDIKCVDYMVLFVYLGIMDDEWVKEGTMLGVKRALTDRNCHFLHVVINCAIRDKKKIAIWLIVMNVRFNVLLI